MPMAEAAKAFGFCLTFFKKICRKNGIRRWPHRKLKSLSNKIAHLQSRLDDDSHTTYSQADQCRQQLAHLSGLQLGEAKSAPVNPTEKTLESLALLSGSPREELEDENTPCSSDPVHLLGGPSSQAPVVPERLSGAHNAQFSTAQELQKHFSLPMAQAAKNFGVSLTLFKKICRKNGIKRWPHRRLQSLASKMTDLQSSIQANNDLDTHRYQTPDIRQTDEPAGSEDSRVISTSASLCNDSKGEACWPVEDDQPASEDEEVAAMCLGMLAAQSVVSDRLSSGSVS